MGESSEAGANGGRSRLHDAVVAVIAASAEVLGAPETVVNEVVLHGNSLSLDVAVGGHLRSYDGPASAIHSMAAGLWKNAMQDATLWGFHKHPTHGYLVNSVEFALFVGDLEEPMRNLAAVLFADGAREEAQLCLLRVIFPEDARCDPLGKAMFADNPARGIPSSAASPAGFVRKVLPLMAASEPTRRLAATRQVEMTLDEVFEETSGKRLDDIVRECRAAAAQRSEDDTLAVRDVARLIDARLDASLANRAAC